LYLQSKDIKTETALNLPPHCFDQRFHVVEVALESAGPPPA
jgi:hypothetical protein